VIFAPNFPPAEWSAASERPASDLEWEKAARLSLLLQIARHALGDVPLVITSWLRKTDAGSAHGTGDGVDFRPPRTLSQRDIFDRVTTAFRDSGVQWGELIFYPFSDWHVHVTLYPVGGFRQVLLADAAEEKYQAPNAVLVAAISTAPAPFPPSQAAGAAAVVLGVGLVAVVTLVAVA